MDELMHQTWQPEHLTSNDLWMATYDTEWIDTPDITMTEPIPVYFVHPPERSRVNKAVTPCDACRRRKTKCDETRPNCRACQDDGYECVYKSATTLKADEPSAAILDSIDRIEKKLECLFAMQASQDVRFDLIEQSWRSPRQMVPSQREQHGWTRARETTALEQVPPRSEVSTPMVPSLRNVPKHNTRHEYDSIFDQENGDMLPQLSGQELTWTGYEDQGYNTWESASTSESASPIAICASSLRSVLRRLGTEGSSEA